MVQDFLNEVELEVRDVIRRLSNHPSIVLWSGNNENQVSYIIIFQGVVTTMDHVVPPATAVTNFDRPKLALTA